MALTTDIIQDRRRLKKKLQFWRILCVILATAGIVGISYQVILPDKTERIARLTVSGLILTNPKRNKALKKIAEDTNIKALIVTFDSPGGTFVGGEMLFHQLREVTKTKPVISLLTGTATSAAYMAAIAADEVIASAGTITGSIGVILQSVNITELMKNLGIKPEVIKSSELKGQPNPLELFSPNAKKATNEVINDFFNMFVDIVSERREIPRKMILKIADGRIYSGRMAKKLRLVDLIGSEIDARELLDKKYKVKKSMPIYDIKIRSESEPWHRLLPEVVKKSFIPETLTLDGMLSLWQPSLQ